MNSTKMDDKKLVSLSLEKLKRKKQELRKRVLIRNSVLTCLAVKRKNSANVKRQ